METPLQKFKPNYRHLIAIFVMLGFSVISWKQGIANIASRRLSIISTHQPNNCLQLTNDSALIFQAYLNMPELQKYYPKNADNTYKQVYVMQFPVSFPINLPVSKFGKGLLFKERGQIYSSKAEAFFIVKTFLITGDDAMVDFDYNYHYTTTPAALEVSLKLHKTGSTWSIINAVINHR